jgi:hypothetical protein
LILNTEVIVYIGVGGVEMGDLDDK